MGRGAGGGVAIGLALLLLAGAGASAPAAAADGNGKKERPPVGADPAGGERDLAVGQGELKLPPVGIGLGGSIVDPESSGAKGFLTLRMGSEFKLWRFGIGLDLRLRFDEAFKLRDEDFDETSDYPRFVKYVEFGQKRDVFHARVGRLQNSYLRHGTILGKYYSDIDYDSPKVGAELDLDFGVFGIESITNNIFGFEVTGGAIYAKPLEWTEWFLIEDLRVGATVVADIDAPSRLQFEDEATGDVEVDDDGNIEHESDTLVAYGLDVELPLFENWLFRVTPYTDVNFIGGHGTGEHFGTEFLFDLQVFIPIEVTARGEYRIFQAQYLPTYFDTFYEVERFRYPELASRETKLEALEEVGPNQGIYIEGQVRIPKWARAGATYEVYEDDELSRVSIYGELTGFEFVKVRAHYVKRGIRTGEDVFSFDDQTFFTAQVLFRIYDFLYFDLGFTRTWRVDRDDGKYEPVDSYEPGLLVVISF